MDAQVESQENNKTDISTLVMSDSSFLAKSDDETGQDIRNNHSEKAAVKVDAHVEPTMNSQTDSSTLVTSDTSLLEKSHDETGKMVEKINPLVMTPQKVNEEVEMQNTETDSTLVTSDMCSSFLAKSDNETGNASVKQPEKINLLVMTPQKVNEQVEMQNTETDSTLVTSSNLFLAESEDQTHDNLGKQVKEIYSLKTAAKVDEPVEMQKNTEPDSTLATNGSSQFGKQVEEINPVVMTAPKVDELEMRINTQTDSTSDGSSVASKHELMVK